MSRVSERQTLKIVDVRWPQIRSMRQGQNLDMTQRIVFVISLQHFVTILHN